VTFGEITVLTTRVLPIGVEEAASVVAAWAADGTGRVVCAANVHMVMEAWDDPSFAATLAGADLLVCDGRPLVWSCRLQGVRDARQTRGLDLMLAVCRLAARRGLNVGLYGGEAATADEVRRRLVARFPGLNVCYCWSPPFRPLSAREGDDAVATITAAGVQILFVVLGCPKQERWMMEHRERLACVMLGVGAAFDMVAGVVGVAPPWMQRAGLEWVFRLACEPRRLWRRYTRHNGRFVVLALLQWWRVACGLAGHRS
jgi:N-acetylglucosaminyldiphosphoundecaprenol N-acetyl-beta-D-mannosaminyltransferase